jgi:hypothetical protein
VSRSRRSKLNFKYRAGAREEKSRVSVAFGAVVAAGLWRRQRIMGVLVQFLGRSARRHRRDRSPAPLEAAVFWLTRFLSIPDSAKVDSVVFGGSLLGRRRAVTGGVCDTPPVSLRTFALPAPAKFKRVEAIFAKYLLAQA